MPTPTRPSTGAPVESTWGQEVHDQAFAPAGGRWHSQSASVGTMQTPIPLVADVDPGVWLSAPGVSSLIVPADGGGLYHVEAMARSGALDAGSWQWHVYLNGVILTAWVGTTPGSNSGWAMQCGATRELIPGDVLQVLFWQRPTAAARLDVQRFTATRLGRAWGLA